MAVMLGNIYGALREAGASERTAQSTAEEAASFGDRITQIETDIIVVEWMLGCLIASLIGGFAIVISLLVQ